jgi:hypothetical protein
LPPPAPQPAVSHGPPLAAAPASEPLVAREVDHVLRLGQLHAVPGRDGGEMRLELSPEGLGQVEVRVAVHANAVQATLTAHDDHARQTLEANRAALEAALGRANLRLEGFTVGLGQHQERHEGGGDGRRLVAGAAPDAAPLAAVVGGAPEPVAVANGLSVRA